MRSSLLKLSAAEPDALFLTDSGDGTLFKQILELNLGIPVYAEWQVARLVEQNKWSEAYEDVILTYPVTEETAFHERFREQYGVAPPLWSIDAYDALHILAESMNACDENDVQCMVDYATSLKDYEGAGGTMSFNKDIWAFEKPFALKQIKDKQLVNI